MPCYPRYHGNDHDKSKEKFIKVLCAKCGKVFLHYIPPWEKEQSKSPTVNYCSYCNLRNKLDSIKQQFKNFYKQLF